MRTNQWPCLILSQAVSGRGWRGAGGGCCCGRVVVVEKEEDIVGVAEVSKRG